MTNRNIQWKPCARISNEKIKLKNDRSEHAIFIMLFDLHDTRAIAAICILFDFWFFADLYFV